MHIPKIQSRISSNANRESIEHQSFNFQDTGLPSPVYRLMISPSLFCKIHAFHRGKGGYQATEIIMMKFGVRVAEWMAKPGGLKPAEGERQLRPEGVGYTFEYINVCNFEFVLEWASAILSGGYWPRRPPGERHAMAGKPPLVTTPGANCSY